ncbi:predicted protein [Nematostella vectensis]|uniref:Pyroglutamyl-peptidase I n=1 Tax=Nematostella vectensis TaxID=45351 RepID=A7SIQ9_NEMVE|nr:predicted protein [Nematostella vectensis]|eukprot:XP_001628446.1 predicted protein [Nematostella vectensis]
MADQKPTVLVTGFGPFGQVKVNSSMLAVKALKSSDLSEKVNLVTEEIPVIYDFVKNHIPMLWEHYKPKLCVHVGVHSLSETVVLETCARNDGYQSLQDVEGKFHESDCCIPGASDVIHTPLNLESVSEEVNTSGCPCKINLSNDAGRYLCDFIYYTSLYHGDSPTVFIHLPPVEGPYSKEEMAETLRLLINSMLKQLNIA